MANYITTEELKREVEKLGFEVCIDSSRDLLIITRHDSIGAFASVSTDMPLMLETDYGAFRTLDYGLRLELYNLLDRYARTPLDKRKMKDKVNE